MGYKLLECFEVNERVFYGILDLYKDLVIERTHLDELYRGTKDRLHIFYDGFKTMVCREMYLGSFVELEDINTWRQCVIQLTHNPGAPDCVKSLDGSRAWARIQLLISKKYPSAEERAARMHMFESDYDPNLSQLHYWAHLEEGIIHKFKNCYSWDINGAHNDALADIFPLSRPILTKHYNERHINPLHKKEVNYAVGMMKRKGYKLTYNWIVQRTTTILESAIDFTTGGSMDSVLLYANTDNLVVYKPVNLINPSDELGMFKLEYYGDVYIYRTDNYIIMQRGDKITGTALYQVRDKIDLREGKVVKYDKVLDGYVFKPLNIREETARIYEHE